MGSLVSRFFFQAEDGIRDFHVTGVQTCALPISSKFPLQHRAEFLNGRDLYGEVVNAAREDGLVVIARMDSNRTAEDFYSAHPDWFARMKSGEPYRAERSEERGVGKQWGEGGGEM